MEKGEPVRTFDDVLDDVTHKISDLIVSVKNLRRAPREGGEPIDKTLAPYECLIISKIGGDLLVARNEGGKILVERVSVTKYIYRTEERENDGK